ncbi:MAG: hypothetical protein PVSMB5_19990 [Ktedonobacteraceae bacterium]
MTALIVPIRGDNAYIGRTKQLVGGTPLAPTTFIRPLDGSTFEVDLKSEELWEIDGSRRLGQIIKNRQMVKIKVTSTPRINEVGLIEQAVMGAGSDLITPGTPAGTLNTALVANSGTTVVVTGSFNAFNTPASSTVYLIIVDPTNGDEVIPCALPSTGSGPYVFTIASSYNSGHPKLAHAGSNVLTVAVLTVANTALTSSATKGATTIVVGNNSGLTGSGTQVLVLSPGTANEETVVVSTPASSGTGPWTFTLANSAVLKNAHSSGDLVYSPVIHGLTDQIIGSYYTFEIGLGTLNGGNGMTIRVRDCVCASVKVSGKAGGALTYEEEWIGVACAVQNTPATVTFETAHPVLLYTQGAWTVDGSSSSDVAIGIEEFTIERKNNLDESIQTEGLTLAAIIFGNLMCAVSFNTIFTNPTMFYKTYFGSTSGTADSQAVGSGSFVATFTQADGFGSISYNIPFTQYSKVGGIQPKKDGKAYRQQIAAVGTSNMGASTYVAQTTINNMQLTEY